MDINIVRLAPKINPMFSELRPGEAFMSADQPMLKIKPMNSHDTCNAVDLKTGAAVFMHDVRVQQIQATINVEIQS